MNWNRHEALAKWRWTQLYISMGRFQTNNLPFNGIILKTRLSSIDYS